MYALVSAEHIHRIALRLGPPTPPPPPGQPLPGTAGEAFPTGGRDKMRGNNIIPLYEANNLPPQPVQIAACDDPLHPCLMCVLKNRLCIQFDPLPDGSRPRPPAGGCFIHGAYRCPKYAEDLRETHAAKPELNLDVAALLEKVDPMVVYKAYCVRENIVPRVAQRGGS